MVDSALAEREDIDEKEESKGQDDGRLQIMLDELQEDADNSEDQRDKANEDMRFIHVTGGQWEGFLVEEFEDRVKLQFDITTPYKNRAIGEWNQNRVEVEYKPDDLATTNEDAKLLNGVRRADFKKNAGKLSTDNAVDEVFTCGYGCFKLATEFEDEGDPENELQRIVFRPINNAYNTVIWDRTSTWIDKRDSRRVNELIPFTRESFEAAYPGKEPSSAFDPEDRGWLNPGVEGNEDEIFIARRYERVKKTQKVHVYKNLESGKLEVWEDEDHELIKDELKANEFREFVRERTIKKFHIEKTVFSGSDILESTKRIAGSFLPIIAIYGYRGWVDGIEWYKGLIRPLKDAQRMFNMQISQLAENSASSGQEKPIFAVEQMLGDIGQAWADTNNKPYLLTNPVLDADGNPIHFGPVGYLKPAALDQSTTALMQIVPSYIQQVTGGAPQDTLDPDASGKAINALLKRENLNTQDIFDNITNSFVWSGVVYESMVQDVYTTPRMIRTLGKDGANGQERLLKVVQDEKTGKLVEANNFAGKRFQVDSDIGPQYDSLREQKVEEWKGMLDAMKDNPAAQKYLPAMLALLMSEQTGPGADSLKKIARRDLILMGIEEAKTDEEKEFLAQTQAQQQQEKNNSQDELLRAAAAQAESEAAENMSKIQNNVATTEKTQAETQQIISDIQIDQAKARAELVGQFDKLEQLMTEINKRVAQGEIENAKQAEQFSKAVQSRKQNFNVVRDGEGRVQSLVASPNQ